MSIRTDLAVESAQQLSLNSDLEGVNQNITIIENAQMEISDISVENQSAAQKLGKTMGRYITVRSMTSSFDEYSDCFASRIDIISKEIKKLCPNPSRILVAGIGNRAITPDAIGPLTADKIFATRHIKKLATELDSSELTEVSVVQPGVLGQTGIEAAQQIKSHVQSIQPDLVIAVDALACADLNHLGTTVQMTDTGISPGSGVENARAELSENTLGTKCIAIGVPTVVDLGTAAEHIFNSQAPENSLNMMVTPRNIDRLVSNSAKYIAYAINKAYQTTLSIEDIQSLVE